MHGHDVKQRFSQIRRAAFCGPAAAGAIVARFTRCRVNACKGGKRLLALKAARITDLSYELRTKGLSDAVHLRNNRAFREQIVN